jgi:hypothetical protein
MQAEKFLTMCADGRKVTPGGVSGDEDEQASEEQALLVFR